MGKRKKVVLTAVIIAIVLVLFLTAAALYKYLAPSSVKKDLNTVFELEQDQVALILDDSVSEERGIQVNGQVYIPVSVACGSMDARIFVDETEKILSYVTNGQLIQAGVDQTTYTVGKETVESEYPLLISQGDGFYVALGFVEEHGCCYIQKYDSPSRLVIMSNRDKTYQFGTLKEDTRVRTGPGKKYAYLTEVGQGKRVIVETAIKQENEYMAVTTEDGITGYIPIERLDQEGEETTWQFDKEIETFEQNAIKGTVCLAWHQVTNEESSAVFPSGVEAASCMNVLSETWFALSDNKGNFTSLANSDYVSQAHASGRKVWGLINDFDSKLKLKKILGTTSIRTKLINSLVGAAIRYDLDGINIDFENITQESASAYLEFLRELTIKCHANDLVVSVDNYTPAEHNIFYDLAEQGRVVDYVILMAYDEHYAGSKESGSVSSLGFVKNGIEGVVAQVPKERVVVGLPFYTRLWKEVKGKKPTSVAYGMSGAESILRANDATSKWNEETGQYYAQYKDDGATYKIWLEEETSIEKKLEVVKANQVAGVAFWKLGLERAVTWKTIEAGIK